MPLCREGETRPGRGDGAGAMIPCSFTWGDNWAPRIEATYDPIGDGRAKIYFNWGRFFARLPNDLAVRMMSADALITRADYADAALTQPIPDGVLAGGETLHFIESGLRAGEIDPDSRSTFKDEVVAGFEMEVLPAVSLGARYVYRDMPRVLEDIGQASMVEYFNDEADFSGVEYFITNPGPDTPVHLGRDDSRGMSRKLLKLR